MSKQEILRENLSDRYYEWLTWKRTRHEKEALQEIQENIQELLKTIK